MVQKSSKFLENVKYKSNNFFLNVRSITSKFLQNFYLVHGSGFKICEEVNKQSRYSGTCLI